LRNGPACFVHGWSPGRRVWPLSATRTRAVRLGRVARGNAEATLKSKGDEPMTAMRQALIVGLLTCWRSPRRAQLNPSRQITIVVPIGAGGGVDATGRLIAEKLQERAEAAGGWSRTVPPPAVWSRRLGRQGRARRAYHSADGNLGGAAQVACTTTCPSTWSPILRRSPASPPRR
jgi:hypothetical protein